VIGKPVDTPVAAELVGGKPGATPVTAEQPRGSRVAMPWAWCPGAHMRVTIDSLQ
jgi:hypothetical protein